MTGGLGTVRELDALLALIDESPRNRYRGLRPLTRVLGASSPNGQVGSRARLMKKLPIK